MRAYLRGDTIASTDRSRDTSREIATEQRETRKLMELPRVSPRFRCGNVRVVGVVFTVGEDS